MNTLKLKPRLHSLLSGLLALTATSALAADSYDLVLKPSTSTAAFSLAGEKTRTTYGTEEYETTCTRQEEYTDYRQECDHETVERCDQVPGDQTCTEYPGEETCRDVPGESVCHDVTVPGSCHSVPVCRDVPREVCNSRGCTSTMTHECTTREACSPASSSRVCEAGQSQRVCSTGPSTTSCTTSAPQTVCSSEVVTTGCHDVPYTATRDVGYSCTDTRTVETGTETVEKLTADIKVEVTGDLQGLTGKDLVRISVANGNDLNRADLVIESAGTGDTHIIRLANLTQSKTSEGNESSRITATIQLEVIPLSSIRTRLTKIEDLEVSGNSITLTASGDPVDPSVTLALTTRKKRFLKSPKEGFAKTYKASELKVTEVAGKLKIQADFGVSLTSGRREYTVKLTRDLQALVGTGILNKSVAEKLQNELTSTLTKRVKLRGRDLK